jgi:hypothetical protein
MSDDSSDTRDMGVEFGPLADDLEDADYPISHGNLLQRYGDRELEFADGEQTLREVLDDENEREYEDARGVKQAVLNMVDADAVGEEGQSGRGGGSIGIDDDEEEASF